MVPQISVDVINTIFEQLRRGNPGENMQNEIKILESENPAILSLFKLVADDDRFDARDATIATFFGIVVYKSIKSQLEIEELESCD